MNTAAFSLQSKRVLTPEGLRPARLRINEGRIVALDVADTSPVDSTCLDLGELVVMPGVIDVHVHVNEPGRTEWEGFETATQSAIRGGVTTIVDMPLNSTPVTTSVQHFNLKQQAAKKNAWCNIGFHAGLVPQNAGDLRDLLESGVLGIKAFMVHSGINDFPEVHEAHLRQALPRIRESGVPLLVHAEVECADRPSMRNPRSYLEYYQSRPPRMELDALRLLINLCREFKTHIHIVHLATAEALDLLRSAKAEGLPLSVETCPHYLTFSAEEILDGETQYKCAPPIRDAENREGLWRGLFDGTIDLVASDHSPCEPKLKCLEEGNFQSAWGGIASLQFLLSATWSEAKKRGGTLEQLVQWLCERPAKLVGLKQKGHLKIGADADIVVLNPEETFLVEEGCIGHRHKITPYRGRTLWGRVLRTFIRGQEVFNGEDILRPASGSLFLR